MRRSAGSDGEMQAERTNLVDLLPIWLICFTCSGWITSFIQEDNDDRHGMASTAWTFGFGLPATF
ncbi:hypothetical protein ACSAZL_13495 [Methanosarcina sp. T3]|uniref:hypothetical protein n=1 Tax=Methanosarcina sp. T3 TaxID=3439062 RepID=UPI003F84CE79